MATMLASPSTLLLSFSKSQIQPFAHAKAKRAITAHRLITTRAQLTDQSYPLIEQLPTHIDTFVKDALSQSTQFMSTLAENAKKTMVRAAVDVLFKESDEVNIQFEGNFGPVDEIGSRVPVEVIEGAIPVDFPIGVYIRNGSNPQFGGKFRTSPLFGKALFHWFEGDGMLHATYFGPSGQVSYQNKYVETEGYKEEKKYGKPLWLNTVEGDSKAVTMGYFFNQLQFGKVNKATCNTTVFTHAGRLFVNAEGDIPHEIDVSSLSTLGEWAVAKQLGRPFTSHPKLVRDTNELVFCGFAATKPYYMTGIISSDGEKLLHTCDVELERAIISHEIAITRNYDLIMDMPLIIDVQRLLDGGNLLAFDNTSYARIGIKPHFGDAKSIQWFPVEMNYTFHILNCYEEGKEVVSHGYRARTSFLPSKPNMDKIEWFARGIKPTSIEQAQDPSIDGALFSTLHEWRFNLETGDVIERDLTNHSSSMEMPRINEKYVGYKNKFAYAQVVDHEASSLVGMPKYGQLVKITMPEKEESCGLEFYQPGHGIFLSEPLFVPRLNGSLEDDGWVVAYVHNENNNTSEVHIIDAQKFCEPPIARIKLPQRVPYGFHGTFVHGSY